MNFDFHKMVQLTPPPEKKGLTEKDEASYVNDSKIGYFRPNEISYFW